MRKPLTTPEAAAHFSRTVHTICRWVREGLLRPMAGTGGRAGYLFHPDEIERRAKQLRPVNAY